ncbi:MAG: hypothetical protein M3N95_12220 [Actinomycetota bacterium]|nr:hypothetical protein [Actinomycetota bacterium]
MGAAIDALLENVVAHASEGVAFSLTLAPTGDGARLVIADEGTESPKPPRSAAAATAAPAGSGSTSCAGARGCRRVDVDHVGTLGRRRDHPAPIQPVAGSHQALGQA